MSRLMPCFAAGALLLAAATADQAAAETPHHPEPAWCNKVDLFDSASLADALSRKDARDALYAITYNMCETGYRGDDVEAKWAELEANRVYWSKRLGMSDKDWADVTVWAQEHRSSRGSPSIQYDKKRGLASLDPIEQFGLLGEYSFLDRHYYADALAGRLTATGRASYVERCLASKKVGEWAICHQDVLAFDAKAAYAEIGTATARTGFERIAVRTMIDLIAQDIPGRLAEIKKLTEADEAYGKLFGFGAEVHKQWAKREPATLEAIFTMDDARLKQSRKAIDGCIERTWPGIEAAVGGQPAKKFADILGDQDRDFLMKAVSVLADDETFYLHGAAYAMCVKESDQDDYLARGIGSTFKYIPGLRGPRTTTHTLLLASGIAPDDRSATIDYPTFNRDFFPTSSSGGGVQGVVGKVEIHGETATISFAPKMTKFRECANWKQLNRIIRINDDGTLVYDSVCTKYTVNTHNTAPEAQTVAVRYTTAVKPGTMVAIAEGAVMAVWPKDTESTPIAILGVKVK